MRLHVKTLSILCLALVAVFALAAGIFTTRERSAEVKYITAEVNIGALHQSVSATGTINPVVLVSVGSQVSGTVVQLYADFNDRVRKGQVLLKLDPTIFDAQIRQALATVSSARASLRLAESSFQRNNRLVEQKYVSNMALDLSMRELEVARANLSLADAQLARAQADLANSIIRSPIDGVVIKRTVELGQTVAASFATPTLFQIANDLSKLQIDTNVAEADVGGLTPGQEAEFRVDAYPEKTFSAKMRQFRLAPNVTPTGIMYNVVLDVIHDTELLKPGMTAQVRLLTATRQTALRIPTAALRFRITEDDPKWEAVSEISKRVPRSNNQDDRDSTGRSQAHRIFKLNAQHMPVPVDVTIGLSNFRQSEILSGAIVPGDQVVVRRLAPSEK